MPGQQVGAAEEAEEERHDGVRDLLGAVGVDVEQRTLRYSLQQRGAVSGRFGFWCSESRTRDLHG